MSNFAVMENEVIANLYAQWSGDVCESITPMSGAGSNRRYYRVKSRENDTTVIATAGDDVAENKAFIYLSKHFAALGLPVPEVLSVSDDNRVYLQSDLGDASLFDMLATRDDNSAVGVCLEKTMRVMARVQHQGCRDLDFTRCFPVESMDRRAIMWDLNYFKYCFLKAIGITFSEPLLEDDFERLASMLAAGDDCRTVMLRDFQSRNVMIKDGEPYLIDFQGARRGYPEYDVASMLWQAKAGFTDAERRHYVGVYLDEAGRLAPIDHAAFEERLQMMVLFRLLQVLGAYGFRGYFENKAHFVTSIPQAVANLRDILPGIPASLGYLRGVLAAICDDERFAPAVDYGGLTVRVTSFSYKKGGVPRDTVGNGGGFVFDCRAIHNPGRYEQYKALTGRDPQVIEFLEENGEVFKFLENAFRLVDASVERYISRGFNSLMVSFGCTGGRHRSVYSAEAMARHLREKYGVRVVLEHVAQGITEIYPAR